MLQLFLVRHAKSDWMDFNTPDHDRPLNPRGLHTAPKMAKLMVEKGFLPQLIVSSTANRAISTARFFATAFNISESEILKKEEIYEATFHGLAKVVAGLPDEKKVIFIFGHNPTFTDFANHFSEKLIDNVPTCGIVRIVSTAEKWVDFSDKNSKVVEHFFPKEV